MSAPAVRIAYRDEHLLVLIKPPGLPTTSPAGMRGSSLAAIARGLDPRAPRMHPSSRLDRDVTGLVTFARTDRGIEALLEARRQGNYRRTYLAIVRAAGARGSTTGARSPAERIAERATRTPAGRPRARALEETVRVETGAEGPRVGASPCAEGAVDRLEVEGAWSWAIALDPRDPRLRIALAPGEHGRREQEARTRWEVRARAGAHSLLHLFPDTGRTHQLRVHCACAGVPIVGDTDYGGLARIVAADGRVITPRRPMLHCAMLALPHVGRGGTLELIAEAPEDLRRVWLGVGGDDRALDLDRAAGREA